MAGVVLVGWALNGVYNAHEVNRVNCRRQFEVRCVFLNAHKLLRHSAEVFAFVCAKMLSIYAFYIEIYFFISQQIQSIWCVDFFMQNGAILSEFNLCDIFFTFTNPRPLLLLYRCLHDDDGECVWLHMGLLCGINLILCEFFGIFFEIK